ncbi:DUF5336 domain-containing protein [Mycobacterium sp. E740]|uniref:DUF5336 domain-containing protein n=1 Tax=Mycobacterium sp. E740 TaxID=1834149 RepID=UPI0007FE5B7C|nr:DUF5336 domain-containing protein [Mycobacterium sp. E740]OBI81990.1 hypothetical protein A5663_15140 [Mycobacterium sp. E740]
MSYPSGPPGSPGYPSAQQPTTQFSAQTQQFGSAPSATDEANKLPTYLAIAAAVLGLAVYLSNFAPLFTISASDFPGLGSISGSSIGLVLAVGASLLAGLFAGASLLPRQSTFTAVYAVLAVAAFLLVIAEVINRPSGASIDWGLYLIIAFTLLQAIVAVAALLFESGVISPPAPRPKYDQSYGQQYGGAGQYYGQPGQLGQGHHGGPQHQHQRQGYPSTYPGGYSSGPSTGGYPAQGQQQQQQGQQQQGQHSQHHGQHQGSPTPPTGFPAYGQPPSSSAQTSAQTPGQSSGQASAPTTQAPTQQSSSSQSGPTPS